MAEGIPCQWCGYMEASHANPKAVDMKRTEPCGNYQPLDPLLMREIEDATKRKNLSWFDALPYLGSNDQFVRRALHNKPQSLLK